MSEQIAKKLETDIEWNGKANVCVHCGKVPETFYVATGHDHTDYDIRWCPCRETQSSGVKLAKGEIYVGCIGDALGNLHHVILLPGDNDDATWEAQMKWVKSIGGDLPTRREQALLYANLKEEFEERAYWSCEAHESESGWAWYQHFGIGSQLSSRKDYELRARAVRRLPIE